MRNGEKSGTKRKEGWKEKKDGEKEGKKKKKHYIPSHLYI